MNDLARLDAELKKYELAYQMTTPDFLLRVADPHDDLSDVEDASFWRATYEIAEKIRTEGDNTVSDLVARLRVNGTSLYDQAADRIEELEAELAEAKAKIEVTDEDALQILRGYWRDVGASFHDAEIKHVVELLEAFVARRKPDPTPELRERGVTLTAEDLADLDDMELHFSNQDTHPRWSRYRRLVTRLFNDDALKGEPK